MMVATVGEKSRKRRGKSQGRQHFDVEKQVRSAFVLQLKNKFQALADMEDYAQSDQFDQQGVNNN